MSGLANLTGVAAADISLEVAAASVRVVATIAATDAAAATALASTLRATIANTTALSMPQRARTLDEQNPRRAEP